MTPTTIPHSQPHQIAKAVLKASWAQAPNPCSETILRYFEDPGPRTDYRTGRQGLVIAQCRTRAWSYS